MITNSSIVIYMEGGDGNDSLERLPSKQRVVGSNPSRDALASTFALSQAIDDKKGNYLTKTAPKCYNQRASSTVSYQCQEFQVMTLSDALVAYKTYARAEGKSPKTVRWVTSSVGYFADFLGPERQDIASIVSNDLRRFIIALQSKQKFSQHPYNKPQQAKLSPQSIETYCRAIRAFFGFLQREGFIESNPMAKVKMPKVPETVVPTFTEKEVERLLAQPDKSSKEINALTISAYLPNSKTLFVRLNEVQPLPLLGD